MKTLLAVLICLHSTISATGLYDEKKAYLKNVQSIAKSLGDRLITFNKQNAPVELIYLRHDSFSKIPILTILIQVQAYLNKESQFSTSLRLKIQENMSPLAAQQKGVLGALYISQQAHKCFLKAKLSNECLIFQHLNDIFTNFIIVAV